MYVPSHAVLGASEQHPVIFFTIIAVVGVVVVTAIVVSLFVIVLHNLNRQWPIR